MQSKNQSNPSHVKGWILDLYPSGLGEFAIWIIAENGQRIRLTDRFQPKVYVSSNEGALDRLASLFLYDQAVASWDFVKRHARVTDVEKSKVLEITLKDCRMASLFTRRILKFGRYLQYEVFNCDLKHEQMYLYARDVFPLGHVQIEADATGLHYTLMDCADSTNYDIPPMRILRIEVVVAKAGKTAKPSDPINKIALSQDSDKVFIDAGDEKSKLLQMVHAVKELDPDIIVTRGGDSHLFQYLVRRSIVNSVLEELTLSREDVPLVTKNVRGRTFFSYGRTYYRAPMKRLYGRVHVDERNTFILSEAGLDGLIEVARTCRMPLHTAARSSIGASMSSIQFYQAIKNDVLIPRNKSIPEAFKSAYELLVGDRGGFIYEPEVGVHDDVGEVDFSSMYPTVMVNNNISAETVLCKCCPDSKIRIPELGYNICEKRVGIVPKALGPVVDKRFSYKRLKAETQDEALRAIYDNRQTALKWILVTCFGYLGYRNAKFGTVDGHIGVCAFGREAFLKASRIAEERGFRVIHGIVDSLWLKKKGTTIEEYQDLCEEIGEETKIPLCFEGRYRWIVFLPGRMHPNVGVLNRYYGVMESGKIKARGLEVRRRDTPQFVHDAQMKMIELLAEARNSGEFVQKIPEALKVVREYREKLLSGEVSVWDLIVTKHLSKDVRNYKQRVSQVIAAEQLMKEGVEVSAGKNVRFIFTSAENKRYERRVKAEELIEKGTSSDVKKYLLLLYSAASNLLSPFGYSPKDIYDSVRGYASTKLA